jgi:hypothetical protein
MKNKICHVRQLMIMATFSIALFACSSDDLDLDIGTSSTRVRTINLSPDTPEVDVIYELVGAYEVFVGLNYKEATEYSEVRTRTTVTFRNPRGDEIAKLDDPDFDRDEYNTVYLVNLSGNLQIIQSEDSRHGNSSSAKVRFVHACADAPAVDVKTDSPFGTTLFADDAFRRISDYVLVDPGDYHFVITEAGNNVDALAIFEPVTLSANKIYTLIALGTLDDTDSYGFGATIYDETGDGNESIDLTIGP